ncbi:hypothetical protein [Proteiniphilum sp.]|uniref:hypothetical protein n=1 Tax=Proteiniphilum sp. TaxID=1926877 RepID=UPI002B21F37A|nr:hypothetical protein [Proteiniphilum sp.]MEA4919079.1 hypothetical protein [Proteiniphilum sp.]
MAPVSNFDLKTRLSQRIGIQDIHEITFLIQNNNQKKQELYECLFDSDDHIGYKAAWVMTHFSLNDNVWLYGKQDELIDALLICEHPGKRRLILSLLFRQPLHDPPRIDFLDFCLERMISKRELPGVQSLCMKLAYELCRLTPELSQELKTILEMMEHDLIPSIHTVRKNILKAMPKGKSLQSY